MSEGYYNDGEYIPWTTEHLLDAADAEVGPGCCDDSYQDLRAVMRVAPDLLEVLESIVLNASPRLFSIGQLERAKYVIAKAREQ